MIDPIAIEIFGFGIYWYGLLWVAGFLLARYVAMKMGAPLLGNVKNPADKIDELMLYCLLGAMLGGRLGYAIVYGQEAWSEDWTWVFKIRDGGLSLHGGVVGVSLVAIWNVRKHKLELWRAADVLALVSPLGVGCGRVGNFINGELWGRPTDVPWAMVFPRSGDELMRHPSQLYSVFGEGLLLFAALAWLARSRPRPGTITASFLFLYGLVRFAIGFFREADAGMGYFWLGLSAGQWLSVPMMLAGLGLLAWLWRQRLGLRSRSGASD